VTTAPSDLRFNVAIATYDRRDLLARALESLVRAKKPEGFEQVYVVENGSGDASRDICERAALELPLHYHALAETGKSRALQWLMERLGQGFVLFLDDDVRVGEHVLEAYAAAIREHGRGHFFGGPLLVDYEEPPPDWLRAHLPRTAVGWQPDTSAITLAGPNFFVGPNSFLGPNYGAFVEDVCAVGGFREDIGPGARVAGTDGNPSGQEFELQDRLCAAGYTPAYVPDAQVWHWVPKDRCTPEWALHRVYRHKASQTMLRQLGKSPRGLRWRNVPAKLWSRLIAARLREAFAIFERDPLFRFRASREVRKLRGQIEGHQLAAAQHSTLEPGGSAPGDDSGA
jgi:GT2 family glycosyltransferase